MTMPKNLILIRHGFSQANELLKKQEREMYSIAPSLTPKPPIEDDVTVPDHEWRLTQRGIDQAKAIGQIFQSDVLSQIDAYFVSPYRRTIETAVNLNIKKANWELKRSIRERSWGEIDSMRTDIFKQRYARNYAIKQADPLYWMPPAGESIAGVADTRVSDTLSMLHREHAGENVVMVTHHDFIQATRLVLEHMTDDEFEQGIRDESLDIKNGAALWYSRVDPNTGTLHDNLVAWRTIYPVFKNDHWQVVWEPWNYISRDHYSNEELTKQFLNTKGRY